MHLVDETFVHVNTYNVCCTKTHAHWLVFEGSIPTCACFHLEKIFVTFYSHCTVAVTIPKRPLTIIGSVNCLVCDHFDVRWRGSP